MFYVRSLSLLLLCTYLFALQPPDIYNSKNKRELSDRNGLPQKAEKMTPSLNYTSSSNDRDSKKANDRLSRKKRFAHLTRLKRSGDLEDDDFDDEDEEEENIVEEPYLHCKANKCKNGGSCFQRGQEFWCVCGTNYAGKWCEMKREPSVEGAGCDKSMQYRLAIALGVVILIFIFFIIILIYWCRRRVPRWKNEKQEWDQLLKDRLDDEYKKAMNAPPLLPRDNISSPKQYKQEHSNDGSPKYISLTDIRKYLDNADDNKSPTKDTTNGNRKSKAERLTNESTLQLAEKTRKEPRSGKGNNGNNKSAATLSGGYYLKSLHAQTEMKLRCSESINRDPYTERFASNSKRIQRAAIEQQSSKIRRSTLDRRSLSGKTRLDNRPLSSDCSDDPKERLLDGERSS